PAAGGHTQAIKPIPLRRAVPGGFTRDDFSIDHAARTATCPAGHTVSVAAKGGTNFRRHCNGCPLRSRCTTARHGMHLTINAHDAQLVAARTAWAAGTFADDYKQHRPMVERSLAWLVARGNRRVRYRGVTRNHHALTLRVAAINLRRLVTLGLDNNNGWVINPA
ncbi:MAG: transposase, partial [Acidimicrobiales bacterium]